MPVPPSPGRLAGAEALASGYVNRPRLPPAAPAVSPNPALPDGLALPAAPTGPAGPPGRIAAPRGRPPAVSPRLAARPGWPAPGQPAPPGLESRRASCGAVGPALPAPGYPGVAVHIGDPARRHALATGAGVRRGRRPTGAGARGRPGTAPAAAPGSGAPPGVGGLEGRTGPAAPPIDSEALGEGFPVGAALGPVPAGFDPARRCGGSFPHGRPERARPVRACGPRSPSVGAP